MIFVAAGTQDGREITARLLAANYRVLASVVSSYGKILLENHEDGGIEFKDHDERTGDPNIIIRNKNEMFQQWIMECMDKASAELKVMSTFLLADAYEAERNLPKARELLVSIKDSYPNPEVVISRLASLGQRNESPAVAHLQPGDSPPPDMASAGSADVKMRRVTAK